jgi:tRNA threonylcarbamoyladenosine biosynthesis protein TsaE
MSTEQTWQIESTSLEATLDIAAAVGRRLKGGEVIELVSDLGGGKTAFVRGLAQGLGSHDTVHSPSFTLSNLYKSNKLSLYHFDFYRLADPGILNDELRETLTDPAAVVAVEWPAIVADVLPETRLTIRFRPTAETVRQLDFSYPASLNYLIPNES